MFINSCFVRITICQLSDKEKRFKKDWDKLTRHVQKKRSDLVLLPELPFGEWIAHSPKVDDDVKAEYVGKHQSWIKKIEELGAESVVYTKPVLRKGKFYNVACVWTKKDGHKKVRAKYYFPEENHFYEESWFDRDALSLPVIHIREAKLGILICSELWFLEHSRKLGKKGMDLLCIPRATGVHISKRWLDCAKTASIISGSFCISSNRSGLSNQGFEWGGMGWIIRPGDGKVLALTDGDKPYLTIDLDLGESHVAKTSYPVYLGE